MPVDYIINLNISDNSFIEYGLTQGYIKVSVEVDSENTTDELVNIPNKFLQNHLMGEKVDLKNIGVENLIVGTIGPNAKVQSFIITFSFSELGINQNNQQGKIFNAYMGGAIKDNHKIAELADLYDNILEKENNDLIEQTTTASVSTDFVQPWLFTNSSETEIIKQMKILKRAGINNLIFQYSADFETDTDTNSLYFKNLWYDSALTEIIPNETNYAGDVLSKVMSAAEKTNMNMYIGIGINSEWWNDDNFDSNTWLENNALLNNLVIEELYDEYASLSIFKGFYWPFEMYTNDENFEIKWANMLNTNLDYIHNLETDVPFITTVFTSALYPSVTGRNIESTWDNFFELAHYDDNDIFALQDGIGSSELLASKVLTNVQAFSKVARDNDVHFSIIVENFDNGTADFERFKYQLLIDSYYADDLMAFSYVHYYSPESKIDNVKISNIYDKQYRMFIGQDISQDTLITAIDAPSEGSVYVDSDGNEAPIPKGFFVSDEPSEKNIDDGLVIKDIYENEFVWIPVTLGVKENGYVYTESDYMKVAYARYLSNGITPALVESDTMPSGVNSEASQIDKYAGFYVGRYESVFDYNSGNSRVRVKPGDTDKASLYFSWSYADTNVYSGYMWNNINYVDAKAKAEAMASSYSYDSSIKTGLITGVQWDTVLRFIDIHDETYALIVDGTTWGNYTNSIAPANTGNYVSGEFKSTGSNENWKQKNIYDFAGNLREWTNEREIANNNQYVLRSNSFKSEGLYGNPCYGIPSASYLLDDAGFRVVLYIQ